MTTVRFYHSTFLAWSAAPEEERRFRAIMKTVIVATLLLAGVVPLLDIPELDRRDAYEAPYRFARLIVEEKPAQPQPPPMQRQEPKSGPEQKTEEKSRPGKPAAGEPVAAVSESRPSARERAARTGLLALSAELAELRAETPVQDLKAQAVRRPSNVRPESGGERSVITSRVASGSDGIGTPQPGRDIGMTRLSGGETTRVDAPAGTLSQGARAVDPDSNAPPPRTTEEIQMVFDENKGVLNTLYNRVLRTNSVLAGKVVLKLTILPSGDIDDIEIVSSELRDAELERRLMARVRLFKFGARHVAVTTITYPIDFFPG